MDESIHAYEPLQHQLIRTGKAKPRFLQGVYPFAGRGVYEPVPLHGELRYIVPKSCAAELIYFRAGNLSDDILYLAVTGNDVPIRYFPIGPKSDIHVPLAIVENYPTGTKIEIVIAAPRGLSGTVVVDAGLLEIEAGS